MLSKTLFTTINILEKLVDLCKNYTSTKQERQWEAQARQVGRSQQSGLAG
jgi:hypothetical protein